MQSNRLELNKLVAERQGFEPWIPCGIHAFQACAFSHSAISPQSLDLTESITLPGPPGICEEWSYRRLNALPGKIRDALQREEGDYLRALTPVGNKFPAEVLLFPQESRMSDNRYYV
jgi:hypothetical protein